MEFLLKQALIIAPDSALHRQRLDILISDGRIQAIGTNLSTTRGNVLSGQNLHCSPGWFDTGVQGGDPGLEHREDLRSVSEAAVRGGFTTISLLPNTEPCIHSKSEISYIKRNQTELPVALLPVGAVSRDCAGVDITEMYDMFQAGAVAFSDGTHSIQNNGLMLRALQYVLAFEGRVVNRPFDRSVGGQGQMHEGVVSTSLGLKGLPNLSEELMVIRDLTLAEYTQSKLHIEHISTCRSVELIAQAKSRGLEVSCSAPILNLIYTDEALSEFNEQFKVLPPLRTEADRQALLAGLKDGTIDLISSNHMPWDGESKNLEFPYSEFGAIGLESCYALYQTFLAEELELDIWQRAIGQQPRAIFGGPESKIETGALVNLTVFDSEAEWVVGADTLGSKSNNHPLYGKSLKGRVLGTFLGSSFWVVEEKA